MALNELPDEFKVVLMMFYFDQLSYKEIAASLEIPIGTVMSRLTRAKGRLRQRLLVAENTSSQNSPPVTSPRSPLLSQSLRDDSQRMLGLGQPTSATGSQG